MLNEKLKWLDGYITPVTNINTGLLKRAYVVAVNGSADPSTQNGALFAAKGNILIEAANRFPAGVEDRPERWERPLKYEYVEHAERNVIYAAAKGGYSTDGATMYCVWYACSNCARAIIQAGFSTVIGHSTAFETAGEHWKASILTGMQMLREAGVVCLLYSGKLFTDTAFVVRMNGQEINP
jgi:dCMP deaminase